MPPPPKAKWTTGNPAASVAADGTLSVNVPLKDNNTLVATLRFTLTADRALKLVVDNEPGAARLTGFEAWSDL